MAYIAFELDALNVMPAVGAAAGVSPDVVAHGLLKLWAWCFREETDSVTDVHLAGFFGPGVAPALEAFGFLEKSDAGWRVKGAQRYLRVKEQRRNAGRARSLSAGRSAGKFTSEKPAEDQRSASEKPALTPSTEHRAPNTESKALYADANLAVAAFELPVPDPTKMDSWTAQDFWAACEGIRRSMGYAPERWPSPIPLARMWSEALGLASVRDLGRGFEKYAADPFWRSKAPPAPFKGFLSQWSKYLPTKVNHERI